MNKTLEMNEVLRMNKVLEMKYEQSFKNEQNTGYEQSSRNEQVLEIYKAVQKHNQGIIEDLLSPAVHLRSTKHVHQVGHDAVLLGGGQEGVGGPGQARLLPALQQAVGQDLP